MTAALRFRSLLMHLVAAEAHMTLRRVISHVVNGVTALLIAFAIFFTLASMGVISRPSSENISFGG